MTWGHLDDPGSSPHLRVLNLISPAETLWPGMVTYVQVPVIRARTPSGPAMGQPSCKKPRDLPLPPLPSSSVALPFLPDVVLGFGHDEISALRSIPEWRLMFNRSFVGTFYQAA